jgi:hypothetical protein
MNEIFFLFHVEGSFFSASAATHKKRQRNDENEEENEINSIVI